MAITRFSSLPVALGVGWSTHRTHMSESEVKSHKKRTLPHFVSEKQCAIAECHARYGYLPRYVLASFLSQTVEVVRSTLRRLRARNLIEIHDAGPFTYSVLTESGARRFGYTPPRHVGTAGLFVQFAVAEFAALSSRRVLTRAELFALLTEHLEPRCGPLATDALFRRRWFVDHADRLSLLEVDVSSAASGTELLSRIAARLKKLAEKKAGWGALLDQHLSVTLLSARDVSAEVALAARQAQFSVPISVVRAPVLSHLMPVEKKPS